MKKKKRGGTIWNCYLCYDCFIKIVKKNRKNNKDKNQNKNNETEKSLLLCPYCGKELKKGKIIKFKFEEMKKNNEEEE